MDKQRDGRCYNFSMGPSDEASRSRQSKCSEVNESFVMNDSLLAWR